GLEALDRARHRVVVGDVGGIEAGAAAGGRDLASDLLAGRGVAIEDADRAALLRQPARDRGADAVGAAGHQHGAVLQSAHVARPALMRAVSSASTVSPRWFFTSTVDVTMPRLPFEVGRTEVISISPCTVSPTRAGASTLSLSSSIASPVAWIMLWQSSPSINV